MFSICVCLLRREGEEVGEMEVYAVQLAKIGSGIASVGSTNRYNR